MGTFPATVRRNAYGRQLGSFVKKEDFEGLGQFEMTFIRAPYIEKIENDEVQVLAKVDGKIVAARYKNQIGLAFHPEIGSDTRIHELFVELVRSQNLAGLGISA